MPPCVAFRTFAAALTPSTAAEPLAPYGPVVPVSITMMKGDFAAAADPDPEPDEEWLLLQAARATASTASAARSSRGERLARFLTWPMWDPHFRPAIGAASSTENTSAG